MRRTAGISGSIANYLLLLALAAFAIGPLAVLMFDSVKSQPELATNPIGWPHHIVWQNYVEAWQEANLGIALFNSLTLVIGSALGVCVIAGGAAYSLTRLRMPGRSAVMAYLLVTPALPIQLFLVPLFYLWVRIGLYDNLLGLIIIYWGIFSPFATLLLRSYFLQLPGEVEDAARTDGANELQVLARIVLPISWPGLLTIALIVGLWAWNEFLLAVTFIESPPRMPMATTFFNFQQGYSQNYTLVAAAGMIMMLPWVGLFLALQRRFVAGLTAAGLKG